MTATASISTTRLTAALEKAQAALLAERNAAGHWTGELSASALSTATAVAALWHVQHAGSKSLPQGVEGLISGGLEWLAHHQNPDGGWGDTTKSDSNISTTMLAHAAFHLAAGGPCGDSTSRAREEAVRAPLEEWSADRRGSSEQYAATKDAAETYITRAGGVQAVLDRYGKDKTFSIPILTHCALAGLVDWRDVRPLPFELACVPARLYKTLRLPVVSYALPALIAVGQVRHHHLKPRNPVLRLLRKTAVEPSLKVLDRIQPANGGFLEATPLTSFVTMSLAGMGLAKHAVARRGVQFIIESVRDDGSWPIDTNLATWVTTLSVNALGDGLPEEARPAIRDWLLGQQYRRLHPYTNADPGGWAWTDLPGGVPDADDTSGAILALLKLAESRAPLGAGSSAAGPGPLRGSARQLAAGVKWLLDLQNRDGGWPTFCRGWGYLPFDRSAPDLTAHALRALMRWWERAEDRTSRPLRWSDFRNVELSSAPSREFRKVAPAIINGFGYLAETQRSDGSWLPLWFGNQHNTHDENPIYGTARVLTAYRDAGWLATPPAQRGLAWLRDHQNADGGWGGSAGTASSVEETALAVEALVSAEPDSGAARRGLSWLMTAVEEETFRQPSPIGFYFAKLWYFETLYPLAFTVAALRQAARSCDC